MAQKYFPCWCYKPILERIPLAGWANPDSQVHHSGFLRCDENRDGSTRVSVQMNSVPPAGALGHAVAQCFDVDPHQAMHEDLVRLKSLLEEGHTSTDEGTRELQDEELLD